MSEEKMLEEFVSEHAWCNSPDGAEELTKLLEEARKQEREECAQICESDIINCWSADAQVSAYHLAEAIRAKGCSK